MRAIPTTSRRGFFRLVAVMSTALAGIWTAVTAQAQPLRPTPSCPDAPQPTHRQTEGPYFKPDSPRRESLLEPGISGVRIVVAGVVLSTSCQPVPRALIDVWHADSNGAYDNAGYRLRGHQFTDDQGRYRLETKASLIVGELVAAQSVAGVVVRSVAVSVPDVEQRARDRLAARGQDHAGHDDPHSTDPRLQKRLPPRRVRLEVGALGLPGRRLRSVGTTRRRPEWLRLRRDRRPDPRQRRRHHGDQSEKPATRRRWNCSHVATPPRPDSGNYPSDWLPPLSNGAASAKTCWPPPRGGVRISKSGRAN